MENEFTPIKGMEGRYEISRNGIVRSVFSCWLFPDGKIMSASIGSAGYFRISMMAGRGHRRTCSLHRLIATAFIPNPENKPQVNHINGIKTDNRIENLEWVTNRENIVHAYATGLAKPLYGEDAGTKKITNNQAIEILNMVGPNIEIAERYGIDQSTVGFIKSGWAWGEITGKVYKRKRLSIPVVKLIKKDLSEGLTSKEISQKHGIDSELVYDIKSGFSWSSVIL